MNTGLPLAFTRSCNSLSDTLTTNVAVFAHMAVGNTPNVTLVRDHPPDLVGLWDTGATKSVITQKVVDKLNLKPVRFGSVATADGIHDNTPFYYVNIGLPNHVMVGPLLVSRGNLHGCDVLIGMDIIGCGDFAVSNYNGRTTFTFRVPSIETTDYVKKVQINKTMGPKHGKGKRKR